MGSTLLVQWLDPYFPVPDRMAVILETNVAGTGEILHCFVEFVAGAIGVLSSFGPPVDIDFGHRPLI